MNEYCIIYGTSDVDPGPFVLAVSKDQSMINGFREEHYHICRNGEICEDNRYETFSSDYEIQLYMGHFMTQKMITDFCQHCTSIYNCLWSISDTIERELEYFKFDDYEHDILNDGFGLLAEQLSDITPLELSNLSEQDGHVYGSVLNIESCLEKFLATYSPKAGY